MSPKFVIYHFILRYKFWIIIVLVIFLVLKFSNSQTECTYFEPIDVVYTWVNGSDPKFIENLNTFLTKNKSHIVDTSTKRFDDKNELKFSLRSLEKYAPWINHVYIVTNGQIPYWLNMDYEKVSLITHEDIFLDLNDLPTFSSPAIESHLHRIPGLSKRFIYFNDDIFLGEPIYLDDFYSINRGYVIYLSWTIGECAPDCAWLFVNDGTCDTQCYNEACQMDGSDCKQEFKELGFRKKNVSSVFHAKYHSQVTLKYNGTKDLKAIRGLESSQPLLLKDKLYEKDKFKRSLFNYNKTANKNITHLIKKYNQKIIYYNKLKRRKYHYKINKRNSKLLNRLIESRYERNANSFAQSLQHTNRALNRVLGFKVRHVAAHGPHLLDKDIVSDMIEIFGEEFRITSRNKVRRNNDMQYTTSYVHFLMESKIRKSMDEIFDTFDTDGSGTLSDREIRTLLSKLYELPLTYEMVDRFETEINYCSYKYKYPEVATPENERYVNSNLPTVSKELFTSCPWVISVVQVKFGWNNRYKYDTIKNAEEKTLIFKMLISNISDVIGHLDEIRKNPKKFICLNDNLSNSEENDLVRAVLYDFYISLFPMPSKYELSSDYKNKFLYISDLDQWKRNHFRIKVFLFLCIFTFLYCFVYFIRRPLSSYDYIKVR